METGGDRKRHQAGAGDKEEEGSLYRPWAELNPDLVCRIDDLLAPAVMDSMLLRAVCTPWRAAAPPLFPAFLTANRKGKHASLFSLITGKRLELGAGVDGLIARSGGHKVASSSGWLALRDMALEANTLCSQLWLLVHPLMVASIRLPGWFDEESSVTKMVYSVVPMLGGNAHFAAAAIIHHDQFAYSRSGTDWWTVIQLLDQGVVLTDLLFHDDGKVYLLTDLGNVNVVRLPVRRGAVAKVHNFLPFKFVPEVIFPEPFSSLYATTSSSRKHLVFCDGNLYQVWRNAVCRMSATLQDGSKRYVEKNEIFVLRYVPPAAGTRRPFVCWAEAADLGGWSVFIGKNNPTAVRAVPGVRANCVYWIGSVDARDQLMVYDMATKVSELCVVPGEAGEVCKNKKHRVVSWYFPK